MVMTTPVEWHVISTPDGYKRFCLKQNAYVLVPIQTILGRKIQCTWYRWSAKAKIESIIASKTLEPKVDEE